MHAKYLGLFGFGMRFCISIGASVEYVCVMNCACVWFYIHVCMVCAFMCVVCFICVYICVIRVWILACMWAFAWLYMVREKRWKSSKVMECMGMETIWKWWSWVYEVDVSKLKAMKYSVLFAYVRNNTWTHEEKYTWALVGLVDLLGEDLNYFWSCLSK